MDIKQALAQLINRQHLSTESMQTVMRAIMTGECTTAQIAGFMVALRMKGETLDEIEGAVRVMRELCTPVQLASLQYTVDIVGTGGDGANLFNVSTASSFVVAASGAKVAKHGNRAVSSKSGSADVLEAAGINLQLSAEQTARCIDSIGVGFMFAVNHHAAMRHAVAPRRELGIRTLFNVLGPLTNPAGVKRQVLGVYDRAWCRPLAEVLGRLGSEQVLVVHADDGLDEFSLATPTYVAELKDGQVHEYRICPEDVGLKTQSLDGLIVDNVQESLALLENALAKRSTPAAVKAADMIALNAGAALYVAGTARSIKQGVAMAEDAIHSGLASEKLAALRDFSRALAINV
ncbi:anthranilate phosphoribosyltransferase [Agitococcus lubricus]|uniref:Anthranilate phosphoribosyltransferase n=1 Tax=Agitococcus lubricus TaxID=1077255 RepID=A0A2T5J188_9GAMM|nr:anthranilate phosphoribosyltransferase [Agitococcus lubricus]PTQ90059.1 anthranilate phosphoribosyltransferase [Agitococcus lubricus]